MRGPASSCVCGLVLFALHAVGCGRTEPAVISHSEIDAAGPMVAKPVADPPAAAPAEVPIPRVELTAEFHRTRIGLGGAFWVLGRITNPHPHTVTDARARVVLTDAEGEIVGEAEGRVAVVLGPDARAAVAVLVSDPVEHEQLQLLASAVANEAPPPADLALTLQHEPPQRAELGGWYVVGQVTNTGAEPIAGARVEIQGLDRAGQLLGVDWLVLDTIAAQETIEFDIGDLRYEESPAKFTLKLRRPVAAVTP